MERKRDGLVPIGEALAGLGGPVKALRETSPQARRVFTQADQVHQLVGASEADPEPKHRELGRGLLRALIRDAGLTRKGFFKLLSGR